MKRTGLWLTGTLAAAVAAVWIISCGGGGSGGFDGDVSINIGSKGQNIPLTAGLTWSRAFTVTYDVGRFGGPFGSLGMDLVENLGGITFTPDSPPAGLSGGTRPLGTMGGLLSLRVAAAEAASTVCTDGDLYGPFSIVLDGSYQPLSVDPSSAQARTTTLDIVNIGSYSVCVQVVSPVDAVADLNRVGFQVSQCADPPEDISGEWTGDYSCTGSCPESGTVTLTIVQNASDPSLASYTDGSGATYEGTVCGRRFSFRGGVTGEYRESGTFVMDQDGVNATKTSSYRDLGGFCTGTCDDTLSRAE